jgi:hypothetical protein
MRRAKLGGGATAAGDSTPINVALNRLRVTDGVSLDGFRGEFTTRGGFSGGFAAKVNGAAAVRGTVVPTRSGRSAFRITSNDAGAAIAASGLFGRGRGGAMNLILNPVGAPGNYNGTLDIENIRVKDAPVLAELLGAISVIGLLEQLGGEGILFNSVDAQFRITPNAVEISEGSAVGASLGVSGAGVYRSDTGQLNIQGVVSPIYLVNGVGQIFTRRGEGLFGFNYRLTGSASAPKVSVNPLSILTPGMFREIFRRAPPKVSQ